MNLFSTADLAKLLGLKEHQITYAIRSGRISNPDHIVAGKRIYTEGDIKLIANEFGIPFSENTFASKES